MKVSDAIVQFLEEHRDEKFCAACLALKLRGTREMTSAIAEVEGRGVRRAYGICSVCGNRRLVASLAAPAPQLVCPTCGQEISHHESVMPTADGQLTHARCAADAQRPQ